MVVQTGEGVDIVVAVVTVAGADLPEGTLEEGGEVTTEEAEVEEGTTGVEEVTIEAVEEGVEAGEEGKFDDKMQSQCSKSIPRIFSPPNAVATIDSRLEGDAQNALVRSFKTISINPNELPLRPGLGTQGTAIKLRANFFPVRVPKGPLYEYDVAISPAAGTANRRVKRRIFQLAEQTQDWRTKGLAGIVAHDHSSKLISAKKLQEPLAVRVTFYDEDEQGPPAKDAKEYTLTIKFIQNIDTSALVK